MNATLQKEVFMGLDFLVNDQVLNPRPETELLVETGLWILKNGEPPKHFGEPPSPALFTPSSPALLPLGRRGVRPHILDVGTGSGCIAISLAAFEPSAHVTAVDLSRDALELARENARCLNVLDRIDFHKGDLFEGLDDTLKFDLIVSNPPYIAEDEWEDLPPEVLREPRLALWGGRDGLETIEKLIHDAPAHLSSKGWLALEIGFRQAAGVRNLLVKAGFIDIAALRDFSGIERIVAARHGRI